MLSISAVDNIQKDSDSNCIGSKFIQEDLFKKYDYKQVFFDHLNKHEEVIIVSEFPYFSGIFSFSPTKFLQLSHIDDTTDYLKKIPGFTSIRKGGTNTDPVFRGMSGSRIRILVDNGEILGACCARMDPSSAYICPGTFDILNLIKGPQTVLLGPVISGGILQFERYHPNFNISGIKLHSNIVVGSNNNTNKSIDSIIGNKYGYIRIIGNIAYSDDYRDGNKCQVHSAWYKWNSDAILLLNFNTDVSCEINVGQGNGCANYAANAMDGLCFARENYRIKMEAMNINSVLDKIELYAWYNYVNHLMGDIINNKTLFNKQCGNCAKHVDRCVWGTRGIVTNQWGNIECHSGVDIQINQHKKIKCDANWSTDVIVRDIGIFSELVLSTLSNKKFVSGVRLEHYNGIFEFDKNSIHNTQYNELYSAGFIRYESNVDPSLLYYVGIGTSKRFPDYWELLNVNENTESEYNISSFQLHPERTFQIDTGACFQYLKINGWMSSYVGYIKNFILYNNINEIINNINYVNNVDAGICGTETELSYQFNNNWCIKSNMAWLWGLNISDNCSLSNIPPLEGMITCQWKNKYCNISLLWRLVTASKYNVMKTNFLSSAECIHKNCLISSGFGILSVNLKWMSSKYYTLSAGVNNMFNRTYKEYSSSFYHKRLRPDNINIPIYEPGRIWWLKTEITL